MKNKFITALFVATMALSMTACGNSVSVVENVYTETESTSIFKRNTIDDYYSILVDNETGVCYLEYKNTFGYDGYYGITVMLNVDGTPKIWGED